MGFNVIITEKNGQPRVMEFPAGSDVTIGSVAGNHIFLHGVDINEKHARLVERDGKVIVVDLRSANGTYVNRRKVTAPYVVKPADTIGIGDFTLTVEHDGAPAPVEPAPFELPPNTPVDPPATSVPPRAPVISAVPQAPGPVEDSFDDAVIAWETRRNPTRT